MSQITSFFNGGGSGTVASVTGGNGINITGNPSLNPVVNITAPVSIANGGTNAITMVNTDGVVYFDGTRLVTTTVGTAGQVLTSNGVGLAPTFQAGGGGGGGASTFHTDSGDATVSAGAITIAGGLNIDTSGATSIVTVSASPDQYLTSYRVANASPFVVNATDFYITVDTSTVPITIQLPDAPTIYRRFVVKDSAGNAVIQNITVTTVSGVKLIDGATTFVMNTNYQAAEFVYDNFGYQIF